MPRRPGDAATSADASPAIPPAASDSTCDSRRTSSPLNLSTAPSVASPWRTAVAPAAAAAAAAVSATSAFPKAMVQLPEYVAKKKWNTEFLPVRVAVDAVSAACAATLVAPFIVTIDRSIIENASGKADLRSSIFKSLRTLILRPHNFILSKPFALIFTVYGCTYFTANSVDTISSTVKSKSCSSTTHGTSKFLGTSTANLTLGIWKDSHFTRLFSNTAPRPLPLPTYGLFFMRDCLTIFASFNAPPLLAPYIPDQLVPSALNQVSKQSIVQFVAPATVQFASTPLHLLGLNLYNHSHITLRERLQLVKQDWMKSSLARIARIVPAFGVGGVVNTSVRRNLMQRLE